MYTYIYILCTDIIRIKDISAVGLKKQYGRKRTRVRRVENSERHGFSSILYFLYEFDDLNVGQVLGNCCIFDWIVLGAFASLRANLKYYSSVVKRHVWQRIKNKNSNYRRTRIRHVWHELWKISNVVQIYERNERVRIFNCGTTRTADSVWHSAGAFDRVYDEV